MGPKKGGRQPRKKREDNRIRNIIRKNETDGTSRPTDEFEVPRECNCSMLGPDNRPHLVHGGYEWYSHTQWFEMERTIEQTVGKKSGDTNETANRERIPTEVAIEVIGSLSFHTDAHVYAMDGKRKIAEDARPIPDGPPEDVIPARRPTNEIDRNRIRIRETQSKSTTKQNIDTNVQRKHVPIADEGMHSSISLEFLY